MAHPAHHLRIVITQAMRDHLGDITSSFEIHVPPDPGWTSEALDDKASSVAHTVNTGHVKAGYDGVYAALEIDLSNSEIDYPVTFRWVPS